MYSKTWGLPKKTDRVKLRDIDISLNFRYPHSRSTGIHSVGTSDLMAEIQEIFAQHEESKRTVVMARRVHPDGQQSIVTRHTCPESARNHLKCSTHFGKSVCSGDVIPNPNGRGFIDDPDGEWHDPRCKLSAARNDEARRYRQAEEAALLSA